MTYRTPRILLIAAAALGASAAIPTHAAAAGTLYVSPAGLAGATGTQEDPLPTLTDALRLAAGGEVVVVGPGTYPKASDVRARTSTVTVEGAGADAVKVAGMDVKGGQKLTIRGIGFTEPVNVTYHDTLKTLQPARDVSFEAADFTASPGRGCFGARNAVVRLTLRDSRFHDCTTGFAAGAGGPIPQSGELTIENNRFERFTADAIQMGQWNDVTITDNVITSIRDPYGTIHNDGIQLTGNDRRVRIKRNRISDSRNQLIFVQDAVGPIHDVIVTDNVLRGAGSVALQSQGATAAQYINNTIWDAKDGGLWLTAGYPRSGTRVVPTDTKLTNNVAKSFRALDGATAFLSAGNVVGCFSYQAPLTVVAKGVTCLPDVGFADQPAGDFHLRADSPARPYGSPLITSPVDADGLVRAAPVPGAFG